MNRKKEVVVFEADPNKNGYLKVPRSLLKRLYSPDLLLRQEGFIWLCIQEHAYFQSGTVVINNEAYPCSRGEWLATYQKIADLTLYSPYQVKRTIARLVSQGFITTLNIKNKIRIRVTHYDKANSSKSPAPAPSSGKPRVQAPTALPPSAQQEPDEEKRERSGGYNFLDQLNNLMK